MPVSCWQSSTTLLLGYVLCLPHTSVTLECIITYTGSLLYMGQQGSSSAHLILDWHLAAPVQLQWVTCNTEISVNTLYDVYIQTVKGVILKLPSFVNHSWKFLSLNFDLRKNCQRNSSKFLLVRKFRIMSDNINMSIFMSLITFFKKNFNPIWSLHLKSY